MKSFSLQGILIDIQNRVQYPAELLIESGRIISIRKEVNIESSNAGHYILPGFIDAHVHIESSMLVPSEFARLAVPHGTVATISDPHEIANVCGVDGVEFMISNGKTVPFKFFFGAPSCVPATVFETAGATLDSTAVEKLLQRQEIKYLSEMMNFPGVLNGDEEVMKKINAAQKWNKPVDGHAPGLRGEFAKKYIDAGISTDHECFTSEEALDKLEHGMKILIREGSAAKNFDALIGLLNDYPDDIMFCSDDKHPDSLVEGHINQLCARAIAKGINIYNVLKAACVNPVLHYKLDVGLLRVGDPADFTVVNNLETFNVVKTYINGELVAENSKSNIKSSPASGSIINNINCSLKQPSDFVYYSTLHNRNGDNLTNFVSFPVIEALDGQLITNKIERQLPVHNKIILPDVDQDILKIVVVNRYKDAPVAKAMIKNFGLKKGAIASSVAHDSHNIVAVGVDDESICRAVNMIIHSKGGISLVADTANGVDAKTEILLPLPVAGLMTTADGYEVAASYSEIDQAAKALGSTLSSPFMTLSFMALLVIPHLKLSDLGLFDGDSFSFIDNA